MRLLRTVLLIVLMVLPALSAIAQTGATQLTCLLEPSREVELSSEVEGVVRSVKVERGDTIKEGAVLLTLHSALEAAALEAAKERAAFAARKVERNQELLDQNLLSGAERDEILTEQLLANLGLREARARLAQRTILSPISGVVADRYVSAGEHVGEQPLMRLVTLDPLHAKVILRSDYYGKVSKGMEVGIDIESGTIIPADLAKYTGKVVIVDRVIDAASGTFRVRVELPNPNVQLPSGLKCNVHFGAAATTAGSH